MTDAERYALGLMVEEMGEVLQLVGKALRFGLDGRGPSGPPYHGANAREMLPAEIADVFAALEFAKLARIFDPADIGKMCDNKLAKLLSPDSKGADGERLAPDVSR